MGHIVLLAIGQSDPGGYSNSAIFTDGTVMHVSVDLDTSWNLTAEVTSDGLAQFRSSLSILWNGAGDFLHADLISILNSSYRSWQ